jgi:hypothetical protein
VERWEGNDRITAYREFSNVAEEEETNPLMQTASIRLAAGSAHVVPNVPWTETRGLDKR